MSKDNNLHDFLQDVADAIKEKKGSNEPINAQNFANEIRSIEGGGEVQNTMGFTLELYDKTICGPNNIRVIGFNEGLKGNISTKFSE